MHSSWMNWHQHQGQGPREKTSEGEMAMQDKGEGESNHVRFFELIFQEDLCVPQTWMQRKHKHRFTHTLDLLGKRYSLTTS